MVVTGVGGQDRGVRVWKCVFGGFLGSMHLDKLSGLLFVHHCLALDCVPAPGCPVVLCWWTGVGRV